MRCARSMNHERDGSSHSAPEGSSCKYIHQLNNQLFLCNVRELLTWLRLYMILYCYHRFAMGMGKKMR